MDRSLLSKMYKDSCRSLRKTKKRKEKKGAYFVSSNEGCIEILHISPKRGCYHLQGCSRQRFRVPLVFRSLCGLSWRLRIELWPCKIHPMPCKQGSVLISPGFCLWGRHWEPGEMVCHCLVHQWREGDHSRCAQGGQLTFSDPAGLRWTLLTSGFFMFLRFSYATSKGLWDMTKVNKALWIDVYQFHFKRLKGPISKDSSLFLVFLRNNSLSSTK